MGELMSSSKEIIYDEGLTDYANKYKKTLQREVLQELKDEIIKLESGWYWRSVSENGVTSFDKDTLSYVHKLIDEKIKELSE